MACCIKLGKYQTNYKYIFIYIIILLFFNYFFGSGFPEEMKISFFRNENYAYSIIVSDIFQYFSILILGLILLKIEKKKTAPIQKGMRPSKLSENYEIFELELIEEENKKINFSYVFYCLIILAYIINTKLLFFFFAYKLQDLSLWSIEIIYVCIFNISVFGSKIYIHQKISIAIILISDLITQVLSIISKYKDDKNDTIVLYKSYPWLYPVGIFGFLLLYLVDAYILCKIKWYFHLKFISISKILIFFGAGGTIFSLIISLISHFIECGNNKFSEIVCPSYEDETKKYFDNFFIFFKNMWRQDRNSTINSIYIILYVIKLFLKAIIYFLGFLIIEYLTPVFYLFARWTADLIIYLIYIIYYLSTSSLNIKFIFDILFLILSFLGMITYLEIIELNFCNLNRDVKENIEQRAETEILELLEIDGSNRSSLVNNDEQ